MNPKTLIVATRNQHKAAELRRILRELDLPVLSLADLDLRGPNAEAEVVEHGTSYLENAWEKATRVAEWCRGAGWPAWVLADDSGLEVAALGGAPGVFSHRFAGPQADDEENRQLLLERLRGVRWPQRGACFRCTMVLVSAQGAVWWGEGRWEGCIATSARGRGGFGYDPVFIPWLPGEGKTAAELEAETKAMFSHRGKAVRSLWPLLRDLLRNG